MSPVLKTGAKLASFSPNSPAEQKTGDFQIERPDWTLFRSLATLGQKAGVPPSKLRRLALKELTDNALDAGGRVIIKEPEPACYVIQDDGPGIDGTADEIARLFSIDRGLVSSKVWRKPQRGALGNGLRVVAGALIASGGGSLIVTTRDQRLTITPHEDGGASVQSESVAFPVGARIEISFGPLLPRDPSALLWAHQAINMADGGAGYAGKSSAHWFDADAFYELVHCSGARPVRDLIANLDGCTGAKAGAIASDFLQRSCDSLTRAETTELLREAQSATTTPSVKRLGAVGRIEGLPAYHAMEQGFVTLGAREPKAHVPFVVEAWAERAEPDCETEIEIYVSRTPITGEATIFHDSKQFSIYGCGLNHDIDAPTKKGAWLLALNITAPFVPITTDGKEPDLSPFVDAIVAALSAAINKAHRRAPKAAPDDSKGILPKAGRGARSDEADEAYRSKLLEFCDRIRKIAGTLDYKVSSRGWCYILEEHGLGKDEFDACQSLINKCRKNGMLPYDLCTEDERRAAEGIETVDDPDLDAEAESALQHALDWHEDYRPVSFWDRLDVYIEVAVEKVDLKGLFGPVCAEHHVPISNKGGWSDINSRIDMMLRFKAMEEKGKACALLYCGDFDPGGLNISDFIHKNFADLAGAVGWSPDNLVIERFGLNLDFIEEHRLTWIDNLKTGSKTVPYPLDDPRHPDHNKPYVQDYLRKYGARKVEANALVVRSEAGRQLCRDALARYIDLDALAAYEAEIAEQREQLRLKIRAILKRA